MHSLLSRMHKVKIGLRGCTGGSESLLEAMVEGMLSGVADQSLIVCFTMILQLRDQ